MLAIRTIITRIALAGLVGASVFLCAFAARAHAQAESSLSVSVTPPLIQLTIGPGETWTSNLKVINSNSYDLSYYTSVVDFIAKGEEGQGTFVPLVEEMRTGPIPFSLASWIQIGKEPIAVAAGESANIPFTVHVPQDAEPGGHYAAILVGTQPGDVALSGPSMRIASLVSSLIFVRIRGEATENGRIREFRALKTLNDTPSADFLLRFENTGNTHVQPQGDIVIYNMWGKKRGELAVNDEGNFGNVLPHSTRRFTFSWSSEGDILDVGRYSAVVTLAYGAGSKRNVSAVTYFWVVPTVPVAIALGSILSFILLITWLIRRYIRRALMLERQRSGITPASSVAELAEVRPPQDTEPSYTLHTLMEPIREGVIDLRAMAQAQPATPEIQAIEPVTVTPSTFLRKYWLFFAFVILLIVGAWAFSHYFTSVLTPESGFQITDVSIQEEGSQATSTAQ